MGYNMRHYYVIALFVLGAIIAAVLGYWLISPLFIVREVNETLEDIISPAVPVSSEPSLPVPLAMPEVEVISEGTFMGLAGHNATGTARLLRIGEKYYMRFEDDFSVTNGPDLFVHFGRDGEYLAPARIDALKGTLGGQNYEIPSELNPLEYNEVWIWCRSFFVPFGKAILK